MKWTRIVLFVQSIYYMITGIWPLIHLPSFVAVTGPKEDYWLVKMVGLLAASIGIALFMGRNNILLQTTVLSLTSALAFMSVDIYFSTTNVISNIYLVDAAVQLMLIVTLGLTLSL